MNNSHQLAHVNLLHRLVILHRSVIKLASVLLLFVPVFAQATLCAPSAGAGSGASSDILTGATVVAPWTNETPVALRSTQTIDGATAMRANLSFWAPIAFDSNGAINAADFDFIELEIRSSIAAPPINVIASSGVMCALNDFTNLQANNWTQLQIPLASLGLDTQQDVGRLKFKSAIAGPFTLWVTDVRLVSSAGEPPEPPKPPKPPKPPEPPEPPPVNSTFVQWHLDPGVAGSVDAHMPDNVVPLNANGQDTLDDTASFAAAIGAIANGGIVDIPAGTYYLSDSLQLTNDNQVLRGAGSDVTHLIFTNSLPYGIAITGGYPNNPLGVTKADFAQRSLVINANEIDNNKRYGLLTDSASLHSQVINITGQNATQNGTRLQLARPLNSSFSESATLELFDANEFSGVEALSLNVNAKTTHVNDMIFLRSAANTWIRDVVSQRAREAHVYTRQTYHCEITGNTFLDATGHGGGKQGYGIDLANSTTGCLIENNTLGYLRHSIILNAGVNGNIIAFNHSFTPRHTKFYEGGPGDISFHNFTYANLVEGNVVERIHVGDSGPVGEGSLIHRNCVTSGPITIGNSPGAIQSVYSNAAYGSDIQLQNTIMPPVLPEAPDPRPYLQPGSTLFDEDGVYVSSVALSPSLKNNWYQARLWNTTEATQSSYYGSNFAPLLTNTITGDWQRDCRIPAVVNAEGL